MIDAIEAGGQAGGFGVRFRVAEEFEVNARADMAWGRDDKTFTLSVGEAF